MKKNLEIDFQEFIKNEDVYQILHCTKNDTQTIIQKNYKRLRLKVKEKSMDPQQQEKELKKLDFAYKILSDEKLKNMYDLKCESIKIKKKSFEDLKLKILDLSLSLMRYAGSKLLLKIQTTNAIVSIPILIKEIYKKKGIQGFYRGVSFFPAFTLTEIIRLCSVHAVFNTPIEAPQSPSLWFAHECTRVILQYPFLVAFDCISISPLDVKPRSVLKMMWGNKRSFYYGFIYYVFISLSSKYLTMIIDQLGLKIRESYTHHLNNSITNTHKAGTTTTKILKYLDLFYNNRFTMVFLDTLVCLPLLCIRSHYPSEILESLLSDQPLPVPTTSPFTISKNIFSQFGLAKFYNGFILSCITKCLFVRENTQVVQNIL
ncbi:hypothetical protein DICPUDRAFT_78762 [Dictyostelium purpureum]|uniref:J domain-containing protein n=1 Tax=Dictyostelium purpureum TaxID=5786 RepID=F0ZKH6_DICPU|nr:uncharacterized protein DICPUDRAFT_78762 [Dictyostelium purpureum]EGC35556.1 hypothetical protein DICPUDRAFT_78762 [Dictyostelium purpureum]|eukprot:XP_003287927.1 hypothetical protein DICPUDRAFT_78762 [Dictyostelium purpureum]